MSESRDDKPVVRVRRRIRNLDDEERKGHKRLLAARIGKAGMWPLNAPGMPPPGPDFVRAAIALGDPAEEVVGKGKKKAPVAPGPILEDLYSRALREPGFTLTIETRKGKRDTVSFVPGHIWGQHAEEWSQSLWDPRATAIPVDGPHPADVMVLGKMPWRDETIRGRHLIGATGEILCELIAKMRLKGADKWYITTLNKFTPPEDGRTIKAGWVKDCLPLLHQELRIVRPKYILCLGADASKKLLGDKYKVSYMAGRVIPFQFATALSDDDDSPPHTSYVMTVIHPVNVAKDPAQARILESNFGRFANLITTNNLDLEEKGLDHRSCYTLEDAADWVQEATYELHRQPDKKLRLTAWDLEWQGSHPVNAGSYVRTVQCSWGDKKAITFVLHHPGGKVAFRDRDGKPAIKRLVALLNEFVKESRPVGHFLVADMEWAEHIGLRLVDHAKVPLYDGIKTKRKAWQRFRDGQGWLDTAMMNHAIEETAPLGLEMLTMRYTMAPRYDIPLEDWKTAYCKERGIKKEGLEGYGDCPDHVLIPYANYDACCTRRIALSLLPLLDRDYEGNCCWEPFWESMIIQKPILRIHQHGIMADRGRIDDSTKKFITWKAKKEEEIKTWAKWPEFNVRSIQQVREFLFGEQLNGKLDKAGNKVRIRPPGAKSLYITPLMDTAKPPRRWSDLVAKGLDADASPGTNKTVLGILAQDNHNVVDQVNMIRDYRFLDQVLKSVLRPPRTDDDDNWVENEDGFLEYDAGLAHSIDDDGRVRTHIYPTAETGRSKHSRPNLANMCLTGDHEVLTPQGWVRFDQLRDGDQVAQFWPDGERIEFVVPYAVVRQKYRGQLVHLTTEDQIDILGTPNHRCLLRQRKSRKWFELPLGDVLPDKLYPQAGRYVGGDLHLSAAEVRWLCAVQADGSYPKQGGGVMFGFKKRRKIAAMREILAEICPEASEYKSEKPTTVGFYIPVASRANQLAREFLPDKRYGSWVLRLDRESLDVMAAEIFFWDGASVAKNSFSSRNKINADWVQIVWALSGWRTQLHEREMGGKPQWFADTVSAHRRVGYSMTTNRVIEEVPFTGTVYCVTVPSSYFVVRRNNRVSVTGNSKSRDPDYVRLLGGTKTDAGYVGGDYTHKLRSILHASPGYVLIEADYMGAELELMAIMSGSAKMMDHCKRAKLPDKGYDETGNKVDGGKFPHPNYYDIHSNVAVLAFRLKCIPTKSGLKSIGKEHFRTLAKNVIFGIAYGRQAKAIALQAREQGVNITPDDAQQVIDAIFEMYPELPAFFEEAKRRAINEKWLCHCFGRFRRFPTTSDYKLEGEFERQAMNFPVQGGIASCLDRAIAYLVDEIERQGLQDKIRLLLTIHDAILVEAQYEYVAYAKQLIRWAMVDMVEIWPTNLAGVPRGDGPYRLDVEFEVAINWSEKCSPAKLAELGVAV